MELETVRNIAMVAGPMLFSVIMLTAIGMSMHQDRQRRRNDSQQDQQP